MSVDDFGLTSLVLLAQDLMGDITRRTAVSGDRAAQLTVAMAHTKLQIDGEVRTRLSSKTKVRAMDRVDQVLKSAQTELDAAERRWLTATPPRRFAARSSRCATPERWSATAGWLALPDSRPLWPAPMP